VGTSPSPGWGVRLVRVTAEHAEQPAHLRERTAAALLDRLQHLARRGVRLTEHAPLGTCLEDDHRDVVRDHIVQLARDPRTLLDNCFTCSDVALALGDPCASVPVADHTPDKEHHDALDQAEENRLLEACSWAEARGEDRRHDEREADCEAAWRRPDRQRIQRTEVRHGLNEDVRAGPERELHGFGDRHDDANEQRVTTANRDRCRHGGRDQRCSQLMMTGARAEPDLELADDRQDDGERPIDHHRVGPQGAEPRRERLHPLKVKGGDSNVIGRSADPGCPKDQPRGRCKDRRAGR
jgi:hypothetical protein